MGRFAGSALYITQKPSISSHLAVEYRKEKASKVMFLLDFMNGQHGEEWTLGNRIKPYLNLERLCFFNSLPPLHFFLLLAPKIGI